MSLQARKLSIIEYLISLKDEKLFKKIENAVLALKEEFPVFTEDELILRAEESNSDSGCCAVFDIPPPAP